MSASCASHHYNLWPFPPKKILLFFLMFFYILSIHSIPHHSLVTLILFVGVFNVVLISSVSSIFSISFIRTASLIFISCCYFIITLSSLVFLTWVFLKSHCVIWNLWRLRRTTVFFSVSLGFSSCGEFSSYLPLCSLSPFLQHLCTVPELVSS